MTLTIQTASQEIAITFAQQINLANRLAGEQQFSVISTVLKETNWKLFFEDTLAFKKMPEYCYSNIIRLPSLTVSVFHWNKACLVHRHLDLAGHSIPAYIFALEGRSIHSVYGINSQVEHDVYLNHCRNQLLSPGDIDFVLPEQAHYLYPLEKFTSVHIYLGSLAAADSSLHYQILQ